MTDAVLPTSLRARLLKTLLLAVLPALLVFAGGLFWAVHSAVWARFDADLVDLAHTLADLVEYDEEGYEFALGTEPEPLTRARGMVTHLQLFGPDGSTLSRTSLLGDAQLPSTGPRDTVHEFVLDEGGALRAITLEFTPQSDEDTPPGVARPRPVILVVARETTATVEMLVRLGAWFGALVVVTLGAASLAAGWAVRRGLGPVHDIARKIEAIDDRALSQRLDAGPLPSEIQPIVRTTNALLDRLERAFARERQLTTDIAHELRTPLGVLQTALELSLRRERSNEDYRLTLAEALDDVRQIARLVASLLELARFEGARSTPEVEEVAIRNLIDERWAEVSFAASERRVSFTCDIPTSQRVQTDRDKFANIVGNLLANAAQYTEPGGWIRVESQPERGVVLAVVDSGPALSPEQLERVFDRFWRADSARSDAGVRCGIGLALVRSLAGVLGFTVHARIEDDGSLAFVVSKDGA